MIVVFIKNLTQERYLNFCLPYGIGGYQVKTLTTTPKNGKKRQIFDSRFLAFESHIYIKYFF